MAATATTVRWKKIDLDKIDDIALETDEVIDRYRQLLLSSGGDSPAVEKLRSSIDVRILQLARAVEKNADDKRSNLLEMQRMKLQRTLEGDIPETRRLAYEEIRKDTYDSTSDHGVPRRGLFERDGDRDMTSVASHDRMSEQQRELQNQQRKLEEQRQALSDRDSERARRQPRRSVSPVASADEHLSATSSVKYSADLADTRDGSPFQREQLREQHKLLQEQQDMLAKLQEQQFHMQDQLAREQGYTTSQLGEENPLPIMQTDGDIVGYPFVTRQSPPRSNGAVSAIRKRGRMVVREYLVTLTPEQFDELQARRKHLSDKKSPLLPFAVFPYLKSRTGRCAHPSPEKREKYNKLDNFESIYLRSQGPYVDSSWLDTYMRKTDKAKWVSNDGFRNVVNLHQEMDAPEANGKLPLYLDQTEII